MNNYNFTQSLDGLNNIEADTINTSNLNVDSLVVDTAEITTLSDCNLVNCTSETPLNNTSIVNKTYVDNNFVDKTTAQSVAGLKTFSVFPQTTAITPTLANELIRKDYVDNNFLDRTNNLTQNVNGLKTFSNNTNFTGSLLSRTNIKLSEWGNKSGNTITLSFPLEQTNTISPTSGTSMILNLPSITNNERGYVFTFIKTYGSLFNVTINATNLIFTSNSTGSSTTNTTLLASNKSRVTLGVGFSGSSNYWMELTDYSLIDRDNNNLLYARLASPNTFTNTNTFNSSLISNNITSPSVTGTNNIYTNLSLDGGIINVGARGSNININCNLNIVESVYGNTTKITTINQEGNSCRFTNNGSTNGNFIFTINEGSTYNTLVINKTSVDVAGDALIDGNLILYDTTPSSTKNVIIGMVGNDLFFTPYLNVPSSTYNFKVSDSASTITTPLIINSTNTTIANRLHLNAGSRYYSGLSYTEVLQTGAQLTIKPVHDNGTIALFSTNSSGTQTQQLLINNTAVSSPRIEVTNLFSTNYNSLTGFMTIGASSETGNILIGSNLTTGNVNIGNATAGSFKTNIRGSLFSTGQATFQNFCPKSETNPSVANDLVKLSYLQNNFCDLSTTQTIGGEKTFTGDITAQNINCNLALYFTDLGNNVSPNKPYMYMLNDVVYFDTVNNYDNYWEFVCVGNIQLAISQYSTEIKNDLIAYEEATFSKQATFNSFCPKTDTNPAVANDLVKLSYLENNFCNLSTSQSIGGEKTFTDDLTAPNIFCNTALYFRDIDASIKKALIFHQADIVYFDTLTVFDNYWKFKCNGVEQLIISDLNTTIENKLKCNSELIHKETQIMNKVKTISTTSPATFEFPLAERWMFTTTGSTQINVTLPELTLSSQAGFNFSFFKTASVTNEVLFTCQGTNKIRGLNSITDLTSLTRISGTGTTGGFYTAEVSTGNFVWISY